MRLDTFRLSRLAAIFSLLLCIPSFGRCDSLDGILEPGADAGGGGVGSNNEKVVDGNDESGDGNESGSGSEDEEEDLYFYLFDNESVVTEYQASSDDEAKDEPDFLYHPQPGHIRIVEFYAQ
jgi:hypothetical protein